MSKRNINDNENDNHNKKKSKKLKKKICESESSGSDSDTETDSYDAKLELLNNDILEYMTKQLEEEKELVIINKEIKSIVDLIEIGKIYDCTKRYNFDVKTLSKLVKPLSDLNAMIGMEKIKQEMVDHILFKIQDFDTSNQSMMHTVIEGPPGTGKTEVAQIIGQVYLAMGVLNNNKFIKATRSTLIAGYLGQTAINTQRIINSATGGILFIDEVYSLGNSEKRDSFSKECIDTINENLTTKKTDFICIIAGYKDDIKDCFFAYNAGLERRFPIRFTIEAYTYKELYEIFCKKVSQNLWSLDTSITSSFFEKHYEMFNFYGGDMELLYNSCKRSHSRRVFTGNDTKKLLRLEDLEKGFESFKNHKSTKKDEFSNKVWQQMFS